MTNHLQPNELEKPKTELVEYLTETEEKELEQYEQEVITLSNNALENAKRAGEILSIIKERKLFSKARRDGTGEVYSDFADYAKAKFGKGKTMAYNYVAVFNVMKTMEEEGLDPLMLGSIQNTLQIHHEIKKLTKANPDLHPLFREIIYKGIALIERISPVDENGNIDVTPESVSAAFKTIGEIAVTGTYEIGGQQIPISLANIAVDDQASKEFYEAIQQRRLLAADDARQKRNKLFEPKPEFKTINPLDESKVKEVHIMCPIHGLKSGESLLQAGFVISCGCRAIIRTLDNKSKFIWKEADKK